VAGVAESEGLAAGNEDGTAAPLGIAASAGLELLGPASPWPFAATRAAAYGAYVRNRFM
jgi:hypothetical protein